MGIMGLRKRGHEMKKGSWIVSSVLLVALAGCAIAPRANNQDALLVGTSAPLIGDGLQESIYFTHLDNRELRNIFDQYPASLSASAGTHMITAVCEWRASASETPVAKHVRRFRMDLVGGTTYQFSSSYQGAGGCQLAIEEELTNKATVTTATD